MMRLAASMYRQSQRRYHPRRFSQVASQHPFSGNDGTAEGACRMLLASLLAGMLTALSIGEDADCDSVASSSCDYATQQQQPTANLSASPTEFDRSGVYYETGNILTNWSNTHSCCPRKIYEPQSSQEVLRVLQHFHNRRERVRPVGTALSPNGIGMSTENLLSLTNLDYVDVDVARKLVTVGAGARVSSVLAELSKHGLTLQNFSSIQEQQMGGWTQVAAHGTGCSLPTVDEMIVRMKLATPTEGIMTLSETSNSRLFQFAKVGLGSLGVVTELTMSCIPKMDLLEHTYTTSMAEIGNRHNDRLKSFRHVRYMWLPFTPTVVIVVSNPTSTASDGKREIMTRVGRDEEEEEAIVREAVKEQLTKGRAEAQGHTRRPATKEMCELLLSLDTKYSRAKAEKLTFSQLRDLLLDHAPQDLEHIKRVNAAEAAFWTASAGSRQDDSTNILGFDCGGEQLVMEVCFPIGTLDENTGKDIDFVRRLCALIEKHGIAAPCPIEQRWSAASSSPMSPAYSPRKGDIFSWVGVIMYLPPSQTPAQREEIQSAFRRYVHLMQPLLEEFGAHVHWAKIELPYGGQDNQQQQQHHHHHLHRETDDATDSEASTDVDSVSSAGSGGRGSGNGGGDDADDVGAVGMPCYEDQLEYMRRRLHKRFRVREFNEYRRVLDPHQILGNELIDELLAPGAEPLKEE